MCKQLHMAGEIALTASSKENDLQMEILLGKENENAVFNLKNLTSRKLTPY